MEQLEKHPQIIRILETIAKNEGYETHKISKVVPNSKGEGFLSQIFAVTIEEETGDRKLEIIVKAAFTNPQMRSNLPLRNCFLNEINFYTEIYPKMQQIAAEANLLEEKFLPKCFKVSVSEIQEILCFENLKANNYEVFDKRLYLSEEHYRLIFQKYGRFHARGFALKQKRPKDYEHYVEILRNVWTDFAGKENSNFSKFMCDQFDQIYPQFKKGEDDAVLEKLEKYRNGGTLQIILKSTERNGNFSTILHGDCWSNNIMFKYDDSKKLRDLRFIDLQITKQGSPVCDLSYCLYSGAPKLIYGNLEYFMTIYHDSLGTTLKELGCDVEQLYPFDVFKEEWKRYAKFGFLMGMMIVRLKMVKQDDIKDYTDVFENETELGAVEMSKEDEMEYGKRMRDLVGHLHEIGSL